MIKLIAQNIDTPFSILILGAEGTGKSSTINALLGQNQAEVSNGLETQTTEFTAYQTETLTLWDSPAIVQENDKTLDTFLSKVKIDHVLLLNEATSRDLGHLFSLLTTSSLKNFPQEAITIALNHADAAQSGRNWNHDENKPLEPLTDYLIEKADSVKNRIKESTKMSLNTTYFCSGFDDEFGILTPFRIKELIQLITRNKVITSKRKTLWQKLKHFLIKIKLRASAKTSC